jgi:uncharacterized membrane protein YkvA (DUF1232 family)
LISITRLRALDCKALISLVKKGVIRFAKKAERWRGRTLTVGARWLCSAKLRLANKPLISCPKRGVIRSAVFCRNGGFRFRPGAITMMRRDVKTTTWKERARDLKQDVVAIALAVRDPRVPWYAKALGACVIAYALSPIDLIPDFIPVLGYLDDLVLVPLGLLLMVRLIPPDILAEHRVAAASIVERPVSRAGAVAVIALWLLSAALLAIWARNRFFAD